MECLQAPLRTPSSPDRSRLVPLTLDYTWLSPDLTLNPTEPGACLQAIQKAKIALAEAARAISAF